MAGTMASNCDIRTSPFHLVAKRIHALDDVGQLLLSQEEGCEQQAHRKEEQRGSSGNGIDAHIIIL